MPLPALSRTLKVTTKLFKHRVEMNAHVFICFFHWTTHKHFKVYFFQDLQRKQTLKGVHRFISWRMLLKVWICISATRAETIFVWWIKVSIVLKSSFSCLTKFIHRCESTGGQWMWKKIQSCGSFKERTWKEFRTWNSKAMLQRQMRSEINGWHTA